MKKFDWFYTKAIERFGEAGLSEVLPQVKSASEIAAMDDADILSKLSLRVFRSGLKHSLVDAKWPAFEKAFFNFNPEKVALMSDEMLEALMQNDQLIRHWGKIKATRINAFMVSSIAKQKGSFASFLSAWPGSDIIGLWGFLHKQGSHLGGNSGAYALRMLGKDTFVLTDDVVAALKAQGIVDKRPSSKADLTSVQNAFNSWQEESRWPLAHISKLLALSIE